ncbi:MAG: phage shock protein operon transcriptional activator [Gammaproteobacteria bacterium]|jgi:psp operon transcriptional activator|nr:phage shock protein operon transcriptional activator [Gammaproteobacteria bacterium]MBT5204367.1 phage shock protein operon transcriptional activator [Gammaproteobacteria bacterium]MBT5602272.1 phage shock protein operon transcriptional activator [Gammaproteobacteria bacterium]MBT6244915.1 phage shock protein operon transcriptional activator [Gammaproteobacteria bacterium]
MQQETSLNDRLLGESPEFLEVLDWVSKIAPLDKPVLVVGERGTGKELIAARIHYLSQRWDQEFIKLNCAAINDTLLETELFGHEAGAFTGAQKRHSGRFERAHGGTLFLDELATTSSMVQEKLLRVIEYGEYERVGGNKMMTADVRLIAATNLDLPGLAMAGKFREDLLDRLAFDVITLPPLRARQEDILLLAEHFGVRMATELELDYFPGLTNSAVDTLLNHAWPGNVRELKNAIERSLYRHEQPSRPIDEIILDPFGSPYRPKSPAMPGVPIETAQASPDIEKIEPQFPVDFRQQVQDFEIKQIKAALKQAQYNQKKAADALGVTYHQLRGYLKKYELL